MASRLRLHEEFIDILDTRGEKESRVYYQEPPKDKMKYPCIKYSKGKPDQKRADDMVYTGTKRYDIIVIDYDPDSEIPDKILQHFPMCSMDKPYIADNLHHTPLTLYY